MARKSVKEAAEYASTIAEIYVTSLASVTASGDLIVTIDDALENGFHWQQLISALPLLSYLGPGVKRLKILVKGG